MPVTSTRRRISGGESARASGSRSTRVRGGESTRVRTTPRVSSGESTTVQPTRVRGGESVRVRGGESSGRSYNWYSDVGFSRVGGGE